MARPLQIQVPPPQDPPPESTTESVITPARREKRRQFLIRENYYTLPKRFKEKTLETFTLKQVALTCLDVVLGGNSLFLTGATGTGKTHLACALVYEWASANDDGKDFPKAKFVPAVEFFLELKAGFDNNTPETDIIDKYSYVPLLVFDDVGAEKVSDWSRQVFYTLIDRRYRQMKQTIITSNLSLTQLAEVMDDRISSRIVEMGRVVCLKGPDWRLEQKG